MSLLIIGTSHVGAVKLGLDTIRAERSSDLAVSYFASTRAFFDRFRFDEAGNFGVIGLALKPRRLNMLRQFNGALTVNLNAYDQILWVGPDFGAQDVVPILIDFAIDGIYEADKRFRLSEAAFRETCRSVISAAYAEMHPIAEGRSNVTVLQAPRLVSAEPEDIAERTDIWFSNGIVRERLKAVLDVYDDEVEAFLRKRGVTLLRQPEATIAEDGLTAVRYNQDAKKLLTGGDQTGRNLGHMNSEYGELCIHDYAKQAGVSF